MAVREVREMGDPILNKVCKEVKELNERTLELIDDMFDTMYETNGVGLAAPQVSYVVHELQKVFTDFSSQATTVEEAKKDILQYLEAER